METYASQGGRILVVDDNEMNRDMLSRRLERRGYDVATADNGRQAIERVESGDFDLVLLDVMMPEMNGYEVLERLKADADWCHIPVVMISAVDEMDSIVRCIRLGAADYLPKPFNATILGARVEACLDRKRLHDREQLYAQGLEREMEIGRRIQAGFLPATLPRAEGWDLAARFRPARQCAGDFYDAFWIPEAGEGSTSGRVGLVVADVCDKGVGSALFMALFRSLLRATAQGFAGAPGVPAASADAHLHHLIISTNDYIARTHGAANMFATVFFGELDPRTGDLLYVNAGHDAPVVVRASGEVERLPPTGPALGMLPGLPFGVEAILLNPGDALVAFTDGVADAQSPEGDFFTEGRLLDLVTAPSTSAGALLDGVEGALAAHTRDAEPFDDVTLLAVLRRG